MRRFKLRVREEAHILRYNKMVWAIISHLDKQQSHSGSEKLPIYLASLRRLTMACSRHEVTEEEFINLVSIFRKMEADCPQVLRLNSIIEYNGDMRTTTIGTHDIRAFPPGNNIQDTIMRYVLLEFAKQESVRMPEAREALTRRCSRRCGLSRSVRRTDRAIPSRS